MSNSYPPSSLSSYQELVPSRLSALLPDGRVIVILISARKRAYSWYQHMRAHNDPTAMAFTFNQVVTASLPNNKTQIRALRQTRGRAGFRQRVATARSVGWNIRHQAARSRSKRSTSSNFSSGKR